jgi:hypothetical protein
MFRRTLSALTVIAALGGSALLPAIALAQERNRPVPDARVYDRNHRDYHQWNGDEDRLYRQYLTDHHRAFREFSRMNKKQQGAYWQWRHEHDRR